MTLTIDLPEEEIMRINAKASAEGLSVEQCAQQLLKKALESPAGRPLAARIREIWSDMPDEVRAKLPADGANRHDHYIYRHP
jgi:hypothetical protein